MKTIDLLLICMLVWFGCAREPVTERAEEPISKSPQVEPLVRLPELEGWPAWASHHH